MNTKQKIIKNWCANELAEYIMEKVNLPYQDARLIANECINKGMNIDETVEEARKLLSQGG